MMLYISVRDHGRKIKFYLPSTFYKQNVLMSDSVRCRRGYYFYNVYMFIRHSCIQSVNNVTFE